MACAVAEWATGIVAGVTGVSAAVVLLIRELRREPSAGIPPGTGPPLSLGPDPGDDPLTPLRAVQGGPVAHQRRPDFPQPAAG